MEYRKLGHTDLNVSELCLGSMQFGWTADEQLSFRNPGRSLRRRDQLHRHRRYLFELGGRQPGWCIRNDHRQWMKKSAIPRDRLVIATKVRGRMGDRPARRGSLPPRHIIDAVEGSLRRLGTDYIDLYQSHWYDENTPIEETLATFNDLVSQGKVRYIGCSNYPAWRLTEAIWVSRLHNLARICLSPAALQPGASR